jgi:hypothetical protein
VQPNVNMNFNVPNPSKHLASMDDHIRFSVVTENAMSAIARILKLYNVPWLRAIGYTPLDSTLLYVSGYDPTHQRFQYQVNQQFGDSRRTTSSGRPLLPPFQAYITGEIHIGGPARH